MSSEIFQDIMDQISHAVNKVTGVISRDSVIIACSDDSRVGEVCDYLKIDPAEGPEVFVKSGFTYRTIISDDNRLLYTVFIEGTDESCAKLAHMMSITVSNVRLYYDEKYDRTQFIKNILLDNILPGDIYVKAKELHFNSDTPRVVFLIRSDNTNDCSAFDVVRGLFPNIEHDFVVNVAATDIVLVKEIKMGTTPLDLEKLARSISDTVSSEFYTKVTVGIGTIVTNVRDLSKSFKEAQAAIEISRVLAVEKLIIRYDNLGIARLIYQLPTSLCSMFMGEVFRKGSIESLDHETMYTVQKFFENSLNVSETSRKLFIHRNTLVYRLDRIYKLTGLDLRIFDDAITFKVAMMVHKYLNYNQIEY